MILTYVAGCGVEFTVLWVFEMGSMHNTLVAIWYPVGSQIGEFKSWAWRNTADITKS